MSKLYSIIFLTMIFSGHVHALKNLENPLIQWENRHKHQLLEWETINRTNYRYDLYQDEQAKLVIDYYLGIVHVKAIGASEQLSQKNLYTTIKQQFDKAGIWGQLPEELKIMQGEPVDKYKRTMHTTESKWKGNTFSRLKIHLVNNHEQIRQQKYDRYIDQFATRYKINKETISHFIELASNYNTYSESLSGNYGLMMINRDHSAMDAVKLATGYNKKPTVKQLYEPKTNILLGVVYLSHLINKYEYIIDPTSRKMVTLAAYHWGDTIAEKSIKPFDKITESQVKYKLISSSIETREFVKRMTTYISF